MDEDYYRPNYKSRSYGKRHHRGRHHAGNHRGGWSGNWEDSGQNNFHSNNNHFRDRQMKRNSERGNRRGRHPPGLKGREIGLWYASQSQKMNEKSKAPTLSMDSRVAVAVGQAIDELSIHTPCETFASGSSTSQVPGNACDMITNLDKIGESEFKTAYKANIFANKAVDMKEEISCPDLKKDPLIEQQLNEEFSMKQDKIEYRNMLEIRKRLPSFTMKDQLVEVIRNNQCVVISGETGCGKTTQVSQFILDDCIGRNEASTCRIVCTQPRRISAITIAERVAEERAENVGQSIGYQIRLEARLPRREGSILYCTTGIVLRWLQDDPRLSNVSHLILDEIHERDTMSDFLICIAKDLIRLRPDMKVILMSATLNAAHFSSYFNNCPTINIPGYTFPVEEFYLEDVLSITNFAFPPARQKTFYRRRNNEEEEQERQRREYIDPYIRQLEADRSYPASVTRELRKGSSEELNLDLIFHLVGHIGRSPPGAVLIFLPGWAQISTLHSMMMKDRYLSSSQFKVFPLHSLMPTANQREIFKRPPLGVRKVVLATNIAETSITIDDIVYVIDGGFIKMQNYDKETHVSTVMPQWVTRANAKQRKGRAGRVQDGVCYHLFTKIREELLDDYQLPEIQRIDLAEVILQVKNLRLGLCKPFLQRIMDPPSEDVVDHSLQMLKSINALDNEENLTPLGFHLARLPMDPLTGKMILMGVIFSCLSPILTVAASLSFKDPFILSLGNEKLVDKIRLTFSEGTKSDHLAIVNVFKAWKRNGGPNSREGDRFAYDNFLSKTILKQLSSMRSQFMDNLKDLKFVNSVDSEARQVNLNSENLSVVKAVITAGLYPNVARVLRKGGGKNKGQMKGLTLPNIRKVSIHPKSVNANERDFESSWMVFLEKIKTNKVNLYDCTMVSNYPLLLFGEKLEYDETSKEIAVDSFVRIKCQKDIADVIQKLKSELNELLDYKISHPRATNPSEETKEKRLLDLIVEFLSSERDDYRDHMDVGRQYDDGFYRDDAYDDDQDFDM